MIKPIWKRCDMNKKREVTLLEMMAKTLESTGKKVLDEDDFIDAIDSLNASFEEKVKIYEDIKKQVESGKLGAYFPPNLPKN
jgi:hypothetical protein